MSEGSNDHRLDRRLLILRLAGAGSAAAVLTSGVAEARPGTSAPLAAPELAVPVQRGSDSDPRDAAGAGRGGRNTTDNDPRDAAGRGRGSARSVTDNDPRDAAGGGRGNGRSATDNDPSDRAGVGRGGRGSTDNDPRDAAGRGRGR